MIRYYLVEDGKLKETNAAGYATYVAEGRFTLTTNLKYEADTISLEETNAKD